LRSPLSPFLPFSFHLLDSIASDLMTSCDNFERDVLSRTLRATAYSTYHTHCLLLTSLVLVFVSRFVLKHLDPGSGNVDSLGLQSRSNSLCALKKVPEPPKARPHFSPLSVDLDAECELPGPSEFDFDFPLFLLSHSRPFPHGLVERSTPLQSYDDVAHGAAGQKAVDVSHVHMRSMSLGMSSRSTQGKSSPEVPEAYLEGYLSVSYATQRQSM